MIVTVVMIIACLGGLILTAYQAIPTWQTTALPFWVNWQILLESYKNWKQLLVGVGAENFLAAFTAGRPATLNMTTIWNTRFMEGSTLLFHVATVYGLVGAAAFGWFLTGLNPVRQGSTLTRVSFLLAALSLIFLPPSLEAFVLIVTILILSEPSSVPKRFNLLWLRYPIAAFILILVVAAGYGLYRAYAAEIFFARSLKAIESRDGTAAYNLQIQAITKNSRITRFHTTYAQTNLALANALAATATGSADHQTTTQLIQQAIREAKIAVGLAPNNIVAWENLASIYQALTGVAQGADQWTVAAYQKAITLDHTNPVLRLRLGGAYTGQQKFDEALQTYATAISLKPDYANVYYNIAFVYRQQKKYLQSSQAIKETLKYATTAREGTERLQKELEELRELLTENEKLVLDESSPTPTPSTNASSPEPLSPLP